MDLELSDEQTWLSESVEALLTREWVSAAAAAGAGAAERERLWERLVAFGALAVDRDDGLGAVELCLIARALGAHLAGVPYLGSTAVRFAIEPLAGEAPGGLAELAAGDETVSIALLEPGSGWESATARTTLEPGGTTSVLRGEKVAVEHAGSVDRLAVVASLDGEPALVAVARSARGVEIVPQPAFDGSVPIGAVLFADVEVGDAAAIGGERGREVVERLVTIGALLAAAEAVGAAGRMLEDARVYAGERRQFGHPIGSFQALRHVLADMYVRHASAWSTVLYAAAGLDDDTPGAAQTASIAKAYVARAAREVAHGAMQAFGGIAFTAEHPAHRFLRRIIVREQQFGDAAHHERALGRALAGQRDLSATGATRG